MSCLTARRPTTNRPMWRATDASAACGLASRQLAWESSSGVIPMPWSVTETITPPPSIRLLDTVTLVFVCENETAFSTNSASRWTTSLTAGPSTATSDWTRFVTRS